MVTRCECLDKELRSNILDLFRESIREKERFIEGRQKGVDIIRGGGFYFGVKEEDLLSLIDRNKKLLNEYQTNLKEIEKIPDCR